MTEEIKTASDWLKTVTSPSTLTPAPLAETKDYKSYKNLDSAQDWAEAITGNPFATLDDGDKAFAESMKSGVPFVPPRMPPVKHAASERSVNKVVATPVEEYITEVLPLPPASLYW